MGIIVQKFGGSSVADIDKIKKVAAMIAEVKKTGHDVAVVVSAMGKTTNSLIDMAQVISENPPKRELDMLLSTGERITMSLLCIALNELGIEAISLTGSQAGIITNDRHNDARVIEVRPFRVQDEMARGKVVVVGGFQGVSYKKDVTTLGRGGSDTSAVALAAALTAERCEIYSDVDGVYSADPAILKHARHLPEISYQHMQEMSMAGAKVLNSEAVRFAKEANIAIYARSTFEPGRETIVRSLFPEKTRGNKSIVYEKDIARVTILNVDGSFDGIIKFFKERDIVLKEIHLHETIDRDLKSRASLVISYKNIYGWENIRQELSAIFQNEIRTEYEFSEVSLVGEGMHEEAGMLCDTVDLMKKNGIGVYGISSASFKISMLVKRESLEQAVQILHRKWIEE